MFIIRIADLYIKIKNRYSFVEAFCKDYLINVSDINDVHFEVEASEEEILREQQTGDYMLSYCESVCIYRNIVLQLPKYDAFFIHASVVEVENEAYAFLAKSGTGKSTHTNLWLEHFEGNARIINGDKPIMRFKNQELYVYGTPWCGKEGYNQNVSSRLKSICFLERSELNRIRKVEGKEFVARLFVQVVMPKDRDLMDLFLVLIDRMVNSIPMYILECNISSEAVITAYEGMR